ncbi:DUF2156 domain-containing protein [Candidatus Parcubacteria bacterium]|nr:MAG: DUF2156 domain-containing protein [Candidatus Parcubacteria bacterium]
MISSFPDFQKIRADQRAEVGTYTVRFKPYSDFNFTNLWEWNLLEKGSICDLNGNLVLLFTDYVTSESFLSFIGTNECPDTAYKLLEFAKSSGMRPELHFVPEESARQLETSGLTVREDRRNFDYVYAIEKLANSENAGLKVKHRLARTFPELHPEARFEIRPITDASIHPHLMTLFRRWGERKKARNSAYDLAHEEAAILRLLAHAEALARGGDIFVSCVFWKDAIIGFGIDEIVQKPYAISHFVKGDVEYKGIYEFMNEKIAQHLLKHNVQLWNWEQDLDMEGLRKAKSTYHPAEFLKKYIVSETQREITV